MARDCTYLSVLVTDTCLDIMAFDTDIEQEKRRKMKMSLLSWVIVAAAAAGAGAAGGIACFFLSSLFSLILVFYYCSPYCFDC